MNVECAAFFCVPRAAEPGSPTKAPRHKWRRQAAVPRQPKVAPAKGRPTASEAVDHYAAPEKPTYGAAAGYGPNQAPLPRKTLRSGRQQRQPRRQQEDGNADGEYLQPVDVYPQAVEPPPPESEFEATVQAGMADLDGIREQMAALEQPLGGAAALEPEPEPEPIRQPGVYAAVRMNHLADLHEPPQQQQQQQSGRAAQDDGAFPPIGRTPRKHASGVPLTSPRNLAAAGSTVGSMASSSFASPGRGGRSGRQKTNKWRPEEELRLAEGVGFFKKSVGPANWEAVAAHVSAENMRGQRPRDGEECRAKWEWIQHGAVLHELKLAMRMADTSRLRDTIANAAAVGFTGPEVGQAQALLTQLQSGQKALSEVCPPLFFLPATRSIREEREERVRTAETDWSVVVRAFMSCRCGKRAPQ